MRRGEDPGEAHRTTRHTFAVRLLAKGIGQGSEVIRYVAAHLGDTVVSKRFRGILGGGGNTPAAPADARARLRVAK